MPDTIQCGSPAITPLSISLLEIHNKAETNSNTIATYQHGPSALAAASTNTRTAEYNVILAMRNAVVEAMQPDNAGCKLPPEFVAEITRAVLTPSLEFATKLYGEIK